ncbi:hypothetical protein N5K21_25300 [Rhizobium pusense]|uniref:Uncharacterized protein n=1 Tax=Agrobacterium pusense TaxID=648995 RepID=A0A6H0ZPA4_9HYPH|nr:hypothetical protein [Agrobacterium pusense]MDH2092047.1 hypothetical protein [Agrobacterium pusense]QIX22588.1 hypothetical protein FOB41_16280 [Agrobacterium pusense]WCK24499.1 hypothetical protein CFBP5496_0002580 [Agrobacterium pusense]
MFRTKKLVRDSLFKEIMSGRAAAHIIRLNAGTPYYDAWLESVIEPSKERVHRTNGMIRTASTDDDKASLVALFLGCVNLALIHELDDGKMADFILEAVFADVYGLHAHMAIDYEPPGVTQERVKKTFEIYRNVSTWQFAKDVEWHCDPIEKLMARIDDVSGGTDRPLAELFEYCAFKMSVVAEFYGFVRGLARGYKVAVA